MILRTQNRTARKGLRELGHVGCRNLSVETRWAQGRYERLPWASGAQRSDTFSHLFLELRYRRPGDNEDSPSRRRCRSTMGANSEPGRDRVQIRRRQAYKPTIQLPFEKLRISGPVGPVYSLGEPMLIHDRTLFLGTLAPVELSDDGAQVHVGHFSPSPAVKNRRRHFAPLMLVEITAFLAERFPSVQAIYFTLTREVEMHGNGLKVAQSRMDLLERMGATNLQMTPRPDSKRPGNFVVHAVWEYNDHNLGALAAELIVQRSAYLKHARSLSANAQAGLLSKLSRCRWLRTRR